MELDPLKVTDVAFISSEMTGNIIAVHTELTMEDGSTVAGKHVFPIDTLEWRAAEYEIDHADLDALLDIVLYEPFLGDPDQPELLLYEAPTVEEARNHHIARIEAVKAKAKVAKKPGPNPVLEQIKQASIVNPEAVRIKKGFVSHGRERRRLEKEELTKIGLRSLFTNPEEQEEARLAQLRSSLAQDRSTSTPREGKKNG